VIGGAFLGSLMFALLKDLHPERTGLINRWHLFFWHFWIPRVIPWTLVNPYPLSCQNSHSMKVLIILTFTPIRLPCRQAILRRRIPDGPAKLGEEAGGSSSPYTRRASPLLHPELLAVA
jgi:hypothetical protein